MCRFVRRRNSKNIFFDERLGERRFGPGGACGGAPPPDSSCCVCMCGITPSIEGLRKSAHPPLVTVPTTIDQKGMGQRISNFCAPKYCSGNDKQGQALWEPLPISAAMVCLLAPNKRCALDFLNEEQQKWRSQSSGGSVVLVSNILDIHCGVAAKMQNS